MVYEIEIGETYRSVNSGVLFIVDGFSKHAQSCDVRMVRYRNITRTFDSRANTEWVIEESLFLKRFEEL